MRELKLFHNDCDWVVAESPEDAMGVWAKSIGDVREDYPDMEWEPWGDDRPLTIDDDGTKITLTGAEWAAKGRAYIGSTEY